MGLQRLVPALSESAVLFLPVARFAVQFSPAAQHIAVTAAAGIPQLRSPANYVQGGGGAFDGAGMRPGIFTPGSACSLSTVVCPADALHRVCRPFGYDH